MADSIQRALAGSPLRTRRGGCLFLLLMGLLLPVALLGQVVLLLGNEDGARDVFWTAIGIGVVASIPALALLWYIDRRERESLWLSAGTVLWGGFVATGLAGLLNSLGGLALVRVIMRAGAPIEDAELLGQLGTAALIAPWVEEAAKAIAVLILFWFLRAEFDNVRDGIVYGGLAGIGFNICEFGVYVMSGYVDTGTAPFASQFAGRFSLFGVESHALWAALTGAGIGLARQTNRWWVRLAAPGLFFLLAVGGHAFNNSIGVFAYVLLLSAVGLSPLEAMTVDQFLALWGISAASHLLLQIVPYGVIAWLLYRSARWERRVIRDYLRDEVGTPVVTPAEYRAIEADRPFRTRRLPAHPSGTAKAIVNAQNELAFRKWHLARERKGPAVDPLVAAWRADIAKLRHQLAHRAESPAAAEGAVEQLASTTDRPEGAA